MDDNLIDNIVYKQWISVDRCILETVSKSADDFVETFCEKLENLLPHSFIAKQQSSFQSKLKLELKLGEFLVIGDFAEITPLFYKMQLKVSIGTTLKQPFTLLLHTIWSLENWSMLAML